MVIELALISHRFVIDWNYFDFVDLNHLFMVTGAHTGLDKKAVCTIYPNLHKYVGALKRNG